MLILRKKHIYIFLLTIFILTITIQLCHNKDNIAKETVALPINKKVIIY